MLFKLLIAVFSLLVLTTSGGCQENKNDQDTVKYKQRTATEKELRKIEELYGTNLEVSITYYRNGNFKSFTPYENGERNGIAKTFYEDGTTLYSEAPYKDNKLEGAFKAYHLDGTLKSFAEYRSGLLDGESISYYPDAKIESYKKYEKNKLVLNKHYTPDGKLEYVDKF